MLRKVFLIVFIIYTTLLSAQLSLSKLFVDNMVLQQNAEVSIWGKATPGTIINVYPSWAEKPYIKKATNDSCWSLKVRTPPASYQSYNINIFTKDDFIKINDVLIGEVWLCSGQSNMALQLKGAYNQGVEGSLGAIVNSKNDFVRFFGVQPKSSVNLESEIHGVWQLLSPKTAGSLSAVSYFFSQKVQKILDVPVGVIICAWGGSRIESWMSKESLLNFDSVKLPKSERDNKVKMQTPTVLFNGMINGLIGYGMRGVLWYQGESNRDIYKIYPDLFASMHKDWEQKWGIGNFPIYSAQITPFAYENMDNAPHSAFMREAQVKIADTQKNTDIIILSDVGDSICIHPPKKQEVGERFAYMVLGKTYGMDFLDFKSPQYKNIEIINDSVIVNFDSPMGVTFNENERTGFEISGKDKVFYNAEVHFDVHYDKSIVLTSDNVPQPVAVRYGWRNYFKATLFGSNGLPVSSFRTDDWEK